MTKEHTMMNLNKPSDIATLTDDQLCDICEDIIHLTDVGVRKDSCRAREAARCLSTNSGIDIHSCHSLIESAVADEVMRRFLRLNSRHVIQRTI